VSESSTDFMLVDFFDGDHRLTPSSFDICI
jgi:hypothetical protein